MADLIPVETLLARIQAGDEDALLALHDQYAGPVYAVAYRVLGEAMAAEEVTQDAFLRVWDHAARYDPARGSFLTWLLTITRRRAIDVLRQQQRQRPPGDATFSLDEHPYLWEQVAQPGTHNTHRELRHSLAAELDRLPAEQQAAIRLAYFYGMSHSDIAAYLHLPLGTIKTRIRLGMEKLRTAWLAEDPALDDRT